MNREDAIYFAGIMEDFLDIPSMVCETIESLLVSEKYKEVIDFIIMRKREIDNENPEYLKERLDKNELE